MRLVVIVLLILATRAPTAEAGDVTIKLPKGMSLRDFVKTASMASGGVFLYSAEDAAEKALGGPFSLTVPGEKFPDVVRFVLGLQGIQIRSYAGAWPIVVVLPDKATTTRFTIAGTKTVVEFNRPPAAWRRMSDAEGAMTAASAKALIAELTQDAGAGRRAAAQLLGLCGPRDKDSVNALVHALGATDAALRRASAEALGRYGYAARSALPTLIKLDDEFARKSAARIKGAVSPALLNPKLATKKAPDQFQVKVATTKGDIVFEVTRAWSPLGADRFYNLVSLAYFHDIAFFRVVKGFVAQFGIHGDPRVNAAWSNANIKDDPVRQSNKRGTVAFANSGRNTRSVQFFINTGDNSGLDSKGFSPFARVIEGMDIVEKLYDGYGERPDQQSIRYEGITYLRQFFGKLDYIKSVTIVK